MESRIGVYLRVSLEDYNPNEHPEKAESQSISGQRRLIQTYIAEDKSLCELPMEEFVDDGYTGTNFERPAFHKMMEKIKSGRISCVIVKDLSRFGRNYLEVGDYLEHLFPALGVRFVAINDHYDSEEFAGSNAGIEIAFKNILHDYYSRDLSVKVRTAQRSRMLTGKYVNVPPYGYKRDPKDKHHLIIDEETAPYVRTIFERLIAGSSTTEVAAYLNQRGIPTPLEAKQFKRKEGMLCEKPLMWTHVAVINIVKNYKYTGAMVNHSKENAKLRDKVQRDVPQEEWIVNEHMHEAIVSHDEYHQAQMALRRVRPHGRKQRDFTDCVYYCGHCGRRLRKTYGKAVYLSCQSPTYIPQAECEGLRFTLMELEEILLDSFKAQVLFLKEMKKKQIKKRDLGMEYAGRLAKLEEELNSCENMKMQLYMDYRRGSLSRDGFMIKKAEQTKRMEQIEKETKRIREEYESYLEKQAEDQEREKAIDQYLPWKGIKEQEFRKVMYQAVERVLVYKDGTLEIMWKFRDACEEYRKWKGAG